MPKSRHWTNSPLAWNHGGPDPGIISKVNPVPKYAMDILAAHSQNEKREAGREGEVWRGRHRG